MIPIVFIRKILVKIKKFDEARQVAENARTLFGKLYY